VTTGSHKRGDRRFAVRRGVVVVLSLIGLALLTAYFREANSGPLHGFQNGTGSLVGPIQAAAARAVEPAQEGWSWTTGLATARRDVERLERDNAMLQDQVVQARIAVQQQADQAALDDVLAGDAAPEGYQPLIAPVTVRSWTSWYSRARLGAGSDDGVLLDAPVIAPAESGHGLVGHVIQVGDSSSTVEFITDPRTRIGARLIESDRGIGIVSSTGSGDLVLEQVPSDFSVTQGSLIATGGFNEREFLSVYPPGVPIGQVTRVSSADGDVYRPMPVRPLVDPRKLTDMVILVPVSPAAKRRAQG
jgi:rod shape-determining protein MreC